MSRYFSERFAALRPYVPGEQPQDQQYVKLNTNESPFPPPQAVLDAVNAESGRLQLYSDPDGRLLRRKLAERCGVGEEQILLGNGSDEVLYLAFMAFCDNGIAFPDISYGFYPVLASLLNLEALRIPLHEDFRIAPEDYLGLDRAIVIANPNAPTGMCLSVGEIESIAAANAGHVVIVDEAYVDFGADSALPLIGKYDNLLVVQTFSKSRSLAGARLGFAAGSAELIADLNTLRCSINPYNVNRMTLAAGHASLENDEYNRANCKIVADNRAWTAEELKKRGFTVLDSRANFVFAGCGWIGGGALYRELKERGVLVRHFTQERIENFVRITIGSRTQMEILLKTIDAIREELSQ